MRSAKRLPIFLVGMLVSIGMYWSFQRGGLDFSVFYEAWRLVIHGHGAEIYVTSPDRFLYAPGFAWVLSPLALFPKSVALAIWNLAKACAVFALILGFGKKIREWSVRNPGPRALDAESAFAIAAAGFVLIARPLLIDFQYGQVNLLILALVTWAIFSFLEQGSSPGRLRCSWFLFGIAAVSKLFALPLLLLPWFRPQKNSRIAIGASLAGVAVAVLIPVLTMGFSGTLTLVLAWREALIAKGLPFESHNQSFIALLHHYFTNNPTHVIALGWNWVVLGKPLLSMQAIVELAMAWSFLFIGFILAWVIGAGRAAIEPIRWTAVATALMFLPSHLIWKPYFVFGYPLAVLLLWQYRSSRKGLILSGFIAMNLTGFDLIGSIWAARLEAASIFLLVHLAYLICVTQSDQSQANA